MRSEDRRDLATATVGAGGLAAGGVVRHRAVERMIADTKTTPANHAIGILRRGSKGQKRAFAAGSALGVASLAPLGVGVTRLATGEREVVKRQPHERSFLSEGLHGSAEALKGRGENALTPMPKDVRATQLGIAGGAGLAGGGLARLALRGKAKGARPALSPIAGGLAATGSLPLTNRAIKNRGYEVTPYGVKRSKTAAVKPSSRASVDRPAPRSFREDVGKAMSDADYEAESQSLSIDIKQLYRAEQDKDPKRKVHWAQQILLAAKDYERMGEPDLVEDASEALAGVMGDAWYRQNMKGGRALLSDAKKAKGPQKRDERGRFSKAEGYLGSRTGYGAQRAAVTAAGHPPLIGPLTAAAAAGKYAPPGQERKHAVRQYTLGSALGVGTGVAGAYGGAKLGHRSPAFERRAKQGLDLKDKAETKLRSAVGLKPAEPAAPGTWRHSAKTRLANSAAAKPLLRSSGAKAGAAAGFFGVKALTGAVAGQTAISLNQRDQTRYNAKHGIHKAAPVAGTQAERKDLAGKKRLSAVLSAAGGTAGLAGLATLRRNKELATTLGIVGGGFGGANALLNVPIQRKEAKAIDPVKKTANMAKAYHSDKLTHVVLGSGGKKVRLINLKNRDAEYFDETLGRQRSRLKQGRNTRTTATAHRFQHGDFEVGKRDSLEIKHKAEHPKLLKTYGDKGPLPKGLDRDTRMKAYEARYVAHGGDKADKYGRRAEAAEAVRNVGLAGATVGGAAWLAARGKKLGPKIATRVSPRAKHHADTAAVASATVGGAAELYGEYARGRRSSYTNSPAGVAGSSLRRMRDYTP